MLRRNVILLAIWATGSFALTLAIFAPARLNADPPALEALPAPSFSAQGITLTMAYDGKPATALPITAAAGEPAKFELVAVNTTDQRQELKVKVRSLSSGAVSPFWRGMPAMKETWEEESAIDLSPGERRAIPLWPKVALESGASINLVAELGEKKATLLSLAVPMDMSQFKQLQQPAAQTASR